MLLVLCVDLDDDLGRKTGIDTPVIGREAVEAAAVALADEDDGPWDLTDMALAVGISASLSGFFTSYFAE